jgi:hypothetical protein
MLGRAPSNTQELWYFQTSQATSMMREFNSLFVSLVYCAESTVRWFVVREKHCWMAADSADKSKRTGRKPFRVSFGTARMVLHHQAEKLEDSAVGKLTTRFRYWKMNNQT